MTADNEVLAATHRAGFVALCGPPNVGKSTLVNRICGEKVSIVSPKPQTTRDRVLGIVHTRDFEMVFIDTPGLHAAKKRLNRLMMRTAETAVGDADVVVFIVEADAKDFDVPPRVRASLKALTGCTAPIILVVNKIDRVRKSKLLPFITALTRVRHFDAVIPLSAKEGDGIDLLLQECAARLPEGPSHYPDDQVTDMTQRKAASELVREQIFLQLGDELPYASAVEIEQFTEKDGELPSVEIHASILVERDSQKAIVIGKGGARLKEIGTLARAQITELLGVPTQLFLHVKAVQEWSNNQHKLRELGYEHRQDKPLREQADEGDKS
jgi:GTP-binding protein Era